jgi:chitin synthase
VYHNDIFDLSDYFHTLDVFQKAADKKFLNEDVTDVFQQQMGQDISKPLDAVYAKMDPKVVQQHKFCLNNAFYVGQKDFRKGAQCQAANYFMLAASIILMSSMGIKCKSPCLS